MKTLILGASGMLGHQIYLKFKESKKFSSVKGVIREKKEFLKNYKFFNSADIYDKVDFLKDGFQLIEKIILKYKPDVVVNCVVIKPDIGAKVNEKECFLINSFLPHFLARLLDLYKGKLIQISTDGVFRGIGGNYSEEDTPDADDLYGRSKFFGEVGYGNHLTIRTSIFGHEIAKRKTGLLEWLLSSPQKSLTGYTNSYFSGIPTNILAETIIKLIFLKTKDILNVGASKKISKYELISIINKEYGLGKKIIPKKLSQGIDRGLNVAKILKLKISLPNYSKMVREMREDFSRLKEKNGY